MRMNARLGQMLALAVVVVALVGVAHAIPTARLSGVISVPLTSVRRADDSDLHPELVHQQHINRGLTRYAVLSGRAEPSTLELLSNMNDRLQALPHSIRKRFNHGGIEELIRHLSQPLHGEGSSVAGSEKHSFHSDTNLAHTDTEPKGFSPFVLDIAVKKAVTIAKRPTHKHSLGLDIQANDLGYMATFQIGTPPRDFRLLVDSGSGDLWVGGENCKGKDGGSCGKHNFLGPKSSSTYNQSEWMWAIRYGSGAVVGHLVTDHVTIAGLTLESFTFGVAAKETTQFTPDRIPFDGIAGTARSIISRQRSQTFIEALHKAGKIAEPIASYKISRVDDQKNDGELTLGAMNPAKYKPETLVSVPNVSKIGFWEVAVDGITVEGQDLKGMDSRNAILDTGSTLFLAPKEDVATIHSGIPGARYNGKAWSIPCNTTTALALKIGGREFSIDARDLSFVPMDLRNLNGYCMSSICEVNLKGKYGGHWLVRGNCASSPS
ncbi:hypothetical protein HGRIS_003581 [Hohenbuehelia grisea]|uniref:Peptidase A1 domain-containing protein n=1 Tax=Hohenbuehelia grisea TaxID=104357 RepID=A0ABR3JG81_9AGAR